MVNHNLKKERGIWKEGWKWVLIIGFFGSLVNKTTTLSHMQASCWLIFDKTLNSKVFNEMVGS